MTGVIITRVIHIGLGAFWAGSILFMALFLDPAVRATLPAGGQVMGAIQARKFVQIMLTLAIITILSGLVLLRRVSGGFQAEYMRSGPGMAYSIGLLGALLAVLTGMFYSRPRFAKMQDIVGKMASTPEAERPALMQQVGAIRDQLTGALRFVASCLAVTVLMMAVARYL